MLKQIGQIYTHSESEMKELEECLKAGGFQVAFEIPTSGVIVKEVEGFESESEN